MTLTAVEECPKCGAIRARWMGGNHECIEPIHPYYSYSDLGYEFDD